MGSEARARIGLWLLIGATLFSFNQVFSNDEYVGPALLGAAVATLLCMAARRLGFGTLLAVLTSLVGLALYVTEIFAIRTTFWGIPTAHTAKQIGHAVADAYRQSSIDYAPVPTRTGYAILMVFAIWMLTTIGETATFRWRLPLLASIGPIALFCLAMVVGTGIGSPILVAMFLAALLTYWALESSHRIRTWGRWVTPWAHQRNVQPDSVTAGLARRMGYSTVAFALIVPFFLPAIGSGLLSWRSDQGGGGSGGDGSTSSGTVNPWVQLDPQDIEQSDTELMHIRASRTSGGDAPASYWRLVSLNTFADGVWTAEALDTFPVSSDGVVTPNQPTVGDNTLEQNVTIQGLRGISVPAAVQPSTIDFFRQEEAEGLVRDETGSLKLPGGLHPDLSYRVVSQIPELSFDALENARIGDPGAEYFQKPPVSPEVQALTDRWVDGAATPFQKLIALQERLRAFDYDTDQPPPDTSDYLSEFLLHDRAGFCQQFATAFALQARILGYPSRVSVGFLPGTSTESSPGEYVVRGTDAHAWPEVYFENYGWIRFEPTPRDDTVAPKYTETAKVPGGPVDTNGPGKAQGKGSTLDELDQAKIPKAFGDVGGLIDPRTGLPAAPGDAVQPTPQWVKTFTVVIQLGALLLVLFLAAVPLLKEWRTRRRYNHATGPRELAGAAFAHFEEEAADLASPRHPFETAQTFAGRLADRGKVTDRTAHRLAQLYEAAVFAPRDLQSGEGAEARELAGDLRHELWSRASWWTRFTRLFSPRSLWAND